MVKQLGYTNENLKALRSDDPSDSFEEPVRAALRLAHAVTLDAHQVSDEMFSEIRKHYSKTEAIELTCVIGLTNYFNRLSTTLRIDLSGSNQPYESYEL